MQKLIKNIKFLPYASVQIILIKPLLSGSQWPRSVMQWSASDSLLGLRVSIPPGAWMSVSCEYCVMSGKSLCDEPIPRVEESCRLWCVIVCDLETSKMRRPWPSRVVATEKDALNTVVVSDSQYN
jgi:hypothetical protein